MRNSVVACGVHHLSRMRIVPIISSFAVWAGLLCINSGCSGDAGNGGSSGVGGNNFGGSSATGGSVGTGGKSTNGGSKSVGGNATTGGSQATGGGSAILGSSFPCGGNTCVVGQSYCYTFVPTTPGGGPLAEFCQQLPQGCVNTTDCSCLSQTTTCSCTASAGAIQITCYGP